MSGADFQSLIRLCPFHVGKWLEFRKKKIEYIVLLKSTVMPLSEIMLDPTLILVNLQWSRRGGKKEQSPRWKLHRCEDMVADAHGQQAKEFRWICCNTKAKCQDEAKVFKETMASELHNKEKLWSKAFKYWGKNIQEPWYVLPS